MGQKMLRRIASLNEAWSASPVARVRRVDHTGVEKTASARLFAGARLKQVFKKEKSPAIPNFRNL